MFNISTSILIYISRCRNFAQQRVCNVAHTRAGRKWAGRQYSPENYGRSEFEQAGFRKILLKKQSVRVAHARESDFWLERKERRTRNAPAIPIKALRPSFRCSVGVEAEATWLTWFSCSCSHSASPRTTSWLVRISASYIRIMLYTLMQLRSTMVMCVWSAALISGRDEWKYSSTDHGALSVTLTGPVKTHRLSVAHWATSDLVRPTYRTIELHNFLWHNAILPTYLPYSFVCTINFTEM